MTFFVLGLQKLDAIHRYSKVFGIFPWEENGHGCTKKHDDNKETNGEAGSNRVYWVKNFQEQQQMK